MTHFYLRKGRANLDPGFTLEVEFALLAGSFTGVVGPSGSGKSTLLRCLAGLETPDDGFVEVQGQRWYHAQQRLSLPPQHRSVGFVFQDYALFPHLTALGNVQFAQKDRAKALAWLDLVGLSNLADRFPHQLSGGQKQRVALVRALAREPKLWLLDEPLSALDEDLRAELGDQILLLQKQTGVTALLVSHSLAEVSRLCTEVLELRAGHLVADRYPV
ncbi:MAG: ATP-binding cassette domain-containing protein [Spirochaetales bacterium]